MLKKLYNRNEILQGASPEVMETFKGFSPEKVNMYLDDYGKSELTPVLSQKFEISENNILLSYGSEDLLKFIFNKLQTKDVVLTHEHHFTFYKKYLEFLGIKLETFKMYNDEYSYYFDIEDCISKIKLVKPKLLLITSPNNPTGNKISFEDLEKILTNTNEETIVILDEAYFGYDKSIDNKVYSTLISKYSNLIIMRTFSKLYALAGLRIAYAFCGDKVKELIKYQPHYLGMSRILEEVAISALNSENYYSELVDKIISEREYLISELNKNVNFIAYKSEGNFIYAEIKNIEIAKTLEKRLDKEDILIAKFVTKNSMRITVGLPEYNKKFIEIINSI